MKASNADSIPLDASNRKLWFYSLLPPACFLFMAFLLCGALLILGVQEKGITWLPVSSPQRGEYSVSTGHINIEFPPKASQPQNETSDHGPLPRGIVHKTSDLEMVPISGPQKGMPQSESSDHGPLPRGIVRKTSDLEMVPISGPQKGMKNPSSLKSLLAIPVGIKQKEGVNQIVKKFAPHNFTVMLFHYDGNIDGWKDLEWCDHALHISAMGQTKWWFAKRFLQPDIVSEYNYIFLWDEDLGVENFDPVKYLQIVKEEGLEISQPAIDPTKSEIHHEITARWRTGNVHRKIHKLSDTVKEKCEGPPCTGWVEMMAPVFSRSAWRCTWKMIQNDLIHAWGLDMKLGYCAQGDRRKNVGVIDSQYIVHKGLVTLGDDKKKAPDRSRMSERVAVRLRSYTEMLIFKKRWQKAAEEDNSWSDPYRS